MPNIPDFQAEFQPGGERTPQMDPSTAAAPGAALARGAGEIGDVTSEFESRYIEARRASDAANVMSKATAQLGDMRFRYGKIADRQQALAGFDQEAAAYQKQNIDSIGDPFVKAMVAPAFANEAAHWRIDAGEQAFGLEASARKGQLDDQLTNYSNAAAAATSPETQATVFDNATAAIHGAVAGGWLLPEEGEQKVIGFKSMAQEVQAKRIVAQALDKQDPAQMRALAQTLNDPASFPGLNQETKAGLADHVERMSSALDYRVMAQQQHADAMGERALARAQAHNEAVLLGGIQNGQSISPAQLQGMADSGQVSAGGVEAITAARDRRLKGDDNPLVVAHLWHAIDTNNAKLDDIYGAAGNGDVSGTTMSGMVRAFDAKNSKAQSAAEKGAFGQLKTILGGGAIDSGNLDVFGAGKEQRAALWAQAQGEWHDRVSVQGQDPSAVLSDMAPRYAKNIPAPVWLPAPKLGAVTDVTSLNAIGKQTFQLHQQKKIDDATYQGQVALLNKYRNYYLATGQAPAAGRAPQQQQQPAPANGGSP